MSKSILKFFGRNSGFIGKNNSAYYEDGKTFWLIDCGMTVFFDLVEKFDLTRYDEINVLVTHLHDDHAGSLGQLVMYVGYECRKKVNVFSMCQDIETRLRIAGVDPDFYNLNPESHIKWIETKHVTFIDSYGFCMKLGGKQFVYTGDTSTLEPFYPYLNDADEFYVDVSTKGIVHLLLEDVLEELKALERKGVDVYLMHLNDEKAITEMIQGELKLAIIE